MSLLGYVWLTIGIFAIISIVYLILAIIYNTIKADFRQGLARDYQVEGAIEDIIYIRKQLRERNIL